MRAGRVGAVGAALVALGCAVGACGQSTAARVPNVAQLPLVDGASIVSQVRECDTGADGFCALTFVIVDRRYSGPEALLASEHRELRRHGWSGGQGDIGSEHAADSPGHKLRVTYANPYSDLMGIDLGWIHRPPQIASALARAMFDQSAAMSMMLEVGAS
jgi:hypothetical protein